MGLLNQSALRGGGGRAPLHGGREGSTHIVIDRTE